MNKGQQFWLDLWQEGELAFHKKEVNADLLAYGSSLALLPKAQILVPLCGKTLDMLWLVEQGYHVTGIELSEIAILQFMDENGLQMKREVYANAIHFYHSKLSIWVADIFSFDCRRLPLFDAIYDRAALVALPEKLRKDYSAICLGQLKPTGKILLKTLDYVTDQITGPPYSVSDSEVFTLYSRYQIKCLKQVTQEVSKADPLYARGLLNKKDSVWLIENGNS